MVVSVLKHGSHGFQEARIIGALVVTLAAAVAAVLPIGYPVDTETR
ncbi:MULTISPECIES: hypothetical protein [unclassified Mycobacteroides]|nr:MULTISPECIES: hypothetical protein [unclassified Mycobacteroides]